MIFKKFTRLQKCKLILLFSGCVSGAFAQCDNIGFESGTTANWICGSGTYGVSGSIKCNPASFPTIIKYDGHCLNEGGTNGTPNPGDAAKNRHTLVNTGTDANSGNQLSCVAPADLFP